MIPDYQSLMLPVLKVTGDGNEHHMKELVSTLIDQFGMTDEEKTRPAPPALLNAFLRLRAVGR